MYWAHSDPALGPDEDGNRWQPLADHLQRVAELAQRLAEAATDPDSAFADLAFRAGMLHDFGKYQRCFQKMLQGSKARCPHSVYGAIALRQFEGTKVKQNRRSLLPAICAVAAHHGGLKDWSDHVSETDPEYPDSEQRAIAEGLLREAFKDHPAIQRTLERAKPGIPGSGTRDLQTRMLLSCLVDADRLNTANLTPVQQRLEPAIKLAQLRESLSRIVDSARQRGTPDDLLALRAEVQQHCATSATMRPGLFSLCVPTGGGKTLAGMRFALEHAAAHPGALRRVIVVIPYLSIIEQNAKIYADVFGPDAVFEHHSGAVYAFQPESQRPEAENDSVDVSWRRLETENWDAPVIVTTSVRFFESLFSNHPSDLRRIHNIARSVIVLDEVQTFPRRLLAPLLGMLRELTADWGCSVVLSTATQPAFEAPAGRRLSYAWPAGTVHPILPPERSDGMARTLQRALIDWDLERRVSWEELAARMTSHSQTLCVVNLRDHASALYDALRAALDCAVPEDCDRSGLFHLSTRMCAAHRLNVLANIRERLRSGMPCRIVSTQLVEAGVDLDVPIAFRALGPLDSIIQVAGRVDREGRLTAKAGAPAGKLIVFRPEDERYPEGERGHYKAATEITRGLVSELDDVQTHHLDAMRAYFDRYYGAADGPGRGEDLAAMRGSDAPRFRALAEAFEMIESRTRSVFVPYGEGEALLSEVAASGALDRAHLRKLQRYAVSLQPYEFEAAKGQGLFELWPGSDLWTCSSAQYDKIKGLLPRIPDDGFVV